MFTFILFRAMCRVVSAHDNGLGRSGRSGWPADKVGMQVTMEALGTMFSSARNIMSWLADSARAVAATGEPVSWHTPLGLPIVQPYRRKAGPLLLFHSPHPCMGKPSYHILARRGLVSGMCLPCQVAMHGAYSRMAAGFAKSHREFPAL